MSKMSFALFVSIPFIGIVAHAAHAAHAADVEPSVLRVKVSEAGEPGIAGWGSAVAVDLSEFGLKGNQYLLSAAHVIRGSARIDIEVAGKWYEAHALYADEDYDVCILKIETRVHALTLSKAVPQGVIGMGFKWGHAPAAINEGICTAQSTNHNKAQWRAALSIAPGCSGGPVLTADGQIAGIVIAGAADAQGKMRDDITIFVPCTILRQWLEGCRK